MANNNYQEGYDRGYADGAAGKESVVGHTALDSWLNTEDQEEWENGYDAGYEDGKAEWEENQSEETQSEED